MDRDHAKIAIAAAMIQAGVDDVSSNAGLDILLERVERVVNKLLPRATGTAFVEAKHG
jgi:hypothetical protein